MRFIRFMIVTAGATLALHTFVDDCMAKVIIHNTNNSAARFWFRAAGSRTWKHGPFVIFAGRASVVPLENGLYDVAIRLDRSRTWGYRRRVGLRRSDFTYRLGFAAAAPARDANGRVPATFESITQLTFGGDQDGYGEFSSIPNLPELRGNIPPNTCACSHCRDSHGGDYCERHHSRLQPAPFIDNPLGIRVKSDAGHSGVVVTEREHGSPAERCIFEGGIWVLDPGEKITHVNGKVISSTAGFLRAIEDAQRNAAASDVDSRDRSSSTPRERAKSRFARVDRIIEKRSNAAETVPFWLTLRVIDTQGDSYSLQVFVNGIQRFDSRFGAEVEGDEDERAVRVTSITDLSPAATPEEPNPVDSPRKLHVGDLVTHVNGQRVTTPRQFFLAVQRSPTRMKFTVRCRSNHMHHLVTTLNY